MVVHERTFRDGIGVADSYTPRINPISTIDQLLALETGKRKSVLAGYLSDNPKQGEWLMKVLLIAITRYDSDTDRRIMETIDMIDKLTKGE